MPKFEDRARLICNLGKMQVTKVDAGELGTKFEMRHLSGVRFIGELPFKADIKIGDLLTLYTEVLAYEFPRSH